MPAEAAHHECSGKNMCFITRHDYADFTHTKDHITCLHLAVRLCACVLQYSDELVSALAPKWNGRVSWELHLSLDWKQEMFVWWRRFRSRWPGKVWDEAIKSRLDNRIRYRIYISSRKKKCNEQTSP